tara:strand:+ start:8851 stop:9099 length:249 start_codon:yes stop_codon:yes gene_type:complete
MPDIEDLINNVANQDFSKAGLTFNELMSIKIADAMEQQKIAVANAIYNTDEEDDDQLELDLDDEDLEDDEDDDEDDDDEDEE